MTSPYLGQILPVAFNFAPSGWALCNGQLILITQNTSLFSILGTIYGGDGRTNFALPNLQGSIPIHAGYGPGPGLSQYFPGQASGEETVTLITSEIPIHTHTVSPLASADERTTDHPVGAYPTVGGIYAGTRNSNAPMGADALVPTGMQPHNNMQPYLTLNYIIALSGIYPPRS